MALTVADVVEVPDEMRVLIRRSKTDQEGQGQEIAIPRGTKLRTVEAVRAWLDAAGISEGPIFRAVSRGDNAGSTALGADVVGDIVKEHCERAGLDPALFAAHSLRAGFLTSGAEAGASMSKLQEVSRHKSIAVLTGYIRRADLFKDHAGGSFL